MLRLRSATRGQIAAALLIATLALGMLGLAVLLPVSPHASAAPAGARSTVHPAAGSANITFTNTLPTPATVPVTLNYTLSTTGPITSANLSVAISFSAGPSNTVLSTNAGTTNVGPNSVTLGYIQLAGSSAIPTTNWNFTATVAVDGTATGAASLTAASAMVLNPVLALTSNVSVYSTFPINTTFSLGIAGNSGIVASASTVTVGIDFQLTQGTCAAIVVGCFVWNPITVINQTLPFSASGNYQYNFTAANLTPILFNGGVLPTGGYSIAPWAVVVNASNPSDSRAVSVAQTTRFTMNTPTAAILSPTGATGGLAVGQNITIAVSYSGDYVASAVVSVINQATKAVTFGGGVFAPGNGGHGGALSWTPGTAGKYNITLTLTFIDNYTAPITANATNVTVGAAGTGGNTGGGITYLNTTHWVNQSYLQGFSPAVGGTLLLVAGLIVGMLVAAILGRMMWSRPAAQPAQAWQQKTGTTTGMSECSVCHQTFNTPAELVEHQKTAHGM